jgi:uncharacterized protein YndB with AHSA1/START domain
VCERQSGGFSVLTSSTLEKVVLTMTGTLVRFESRISVDRPVDDVFERLADLSAYGSWMHRTGMFRRCAPTSDAEPLGLGTPYADATRIGTFRGEVTEFDRPSRLAFRETVRWLGSDAMQARVEYSLAADGDRTTVHHVAVGELYGWVRVMKPMTAVMARAERTRTLRSLRRSLESDAGRGGRT